MGQNHFIETLVEVMLSWMRWVTGWFWSILNSEGTGSGFLGWFTNHWVGVAVFLIIVGVVVDWLIWMIRWRPYWLWLRKRQYVYEEVEVKRPKRRKKAEKQVRDEEFDDPFAMGEDPYAPQARKKQQDGEFSEWDSEFDPYARQEERTEYDPRIYARPTLGEQPVKNRPRKKLPVFGERVYNANVDDGQSN